MKNILIKLLKKPYLKNIINYIKKSDKYKIELTTAINFITSKETDEVRVMHSKHDNIEFMIYNNEDKVVKELLKSLINKYQT